MSELEALKFAAGSQHSKLLGKRCVLRCHRKELNERDEWTEFRREFQTVGAAALRARTEN